MCAEEFSFFPPFFSSFYVGQLGVWYFEMIAIDACMELQILLRVKHFDIETITVLFPGHHSSTMCFFFLIAKISFRRFTEEDDKRNKS